MEHIKIISYNIMADVYTSPDKFPYVTDPHILSWDYRLKLILQKIDDYDADIICLQEVEISKIPTDFIAHYPEYECIHHVINKKRKNIIGNMTFWRKNKFKMVSHELGSYGIFITLVYDDFTFWLANIHLRAGKISGVADRVCQIKSCLKKLPSIPSLICGDFNDPMAENAEIRKLFEACNMTCHSGGISWCGITEHNTFDHIVVRDMVIVVMPNIEFTYLPNETEPSDHCAIRFCIGC